MKLHLPKVLLAIAICSLSYATAATCSDIVDENGARITEIVKEYGSGYTGNGYGVSNRENGEPIESIVHTIGDGASLDSVLGGIHIASGADGNNNHHNDAPLIDAGTDTVSVKNGVIINVEGGFVGQILGGNSISSGGEKAVEALGEKVNVGSIVINVTGGEIGWADKPGEEAIMGGGGRWCGTADAAGIEINISGGVINNKVYAGTNGGSTGYTELNITGGEINADVYGGGRKTFGKVLGDTVVNISGGTINGNVYAGGNQDTVEGNAYVTVSGNAAISGTIYGGGSDDAKVLCSSILEIQTTQSLKIADFDEVKVSNVNATFETFTTAEGGTKFNVGSGATLTLNEVVINGQNNAIVLSALSENPDGSVSLEGTNVLFERACFTIVLSDDAIANAGTLKFDLVACDVMTMFSLDTNWLDASDVRFVREDGTEFTPADFELASTLNADVDLNNPDDTLHGIVVTVSLPQSSIPEPATVTLSLLALAGLAARRRRK